MITSSNPNIRWCISVILATTATTALWAQAPKSTPSDNAGNGSTAVSASDGASVRRSLNEAKALAKTGRTKQAEEVLSKHNKFALDTAESRIESSLSLLDLARELTREGRRDTVPGLVAYSLQRLSEVPSLTQNVRTRATAKAVAAGIYEKFLGDPAAAISHYQAAAQLDPDDKGISETLGRLQRADVELRARIRKGKK